MTTPIDHVQLAAIKHAAADLRERAADNPDLTAALTLIDRLTAEADLWTETWQEDIAFFGGTDPDSANYTITDLPEVIEARDVWQHADNAGLARRKVRATEWDVLEAPGDLEGDD